MSLWCAALAAAAAAGLSLFAGDDRWMESLPRMARAHPGWSRRRLRGWVRGQLLGVAALGLGAYFGLASLLWVIMDQGHPFGSWALWMGAVLVGGFQVLLLQGAGILIDLVMPVMPEGEAERLETAEATVLDEEVAW